MEMALLFVVLSLDEGQYILIITESSVSTILYRNYSLIFSDKWD